MTRTQGFGVFWTRWSLVSVATLGFWLAVQALKPFVALHLETIGASEFQVGLTVAAHPLLSLGLAIPAGRLFDRRGMRRYMLLSLILTAVAGVGYASAGTILQVAGVQLFAGLAELGAWIGIQALITRAGETAFRQRHLALFSIAWGVGIAFGPTLGAWMFDIHGFQAVGLTYSALALLAAAAVAAVPYRDAARAGRGAVDVSPGVLGELRAVSHQPALLAVLAGSFVALWANSLRNSFYPLFLETSGLSVRTIGILMSLAGITTLVGRLPLVWLIRWFGTNRVLVAGTVTAVLSLSLTPLLAPSLPLLALASGLFGLGFGLVTALTVDLMAEHSDDARRGFAMGMRVASNRAAQVLQPLAFGGAAGLVGMAGGFGASGVVMGVCTAAMAHWLRPSSADSVAS